MPSSKSKTRIVDFSVDPAYNAVDIMTSRLVSDVFRDKYAQKSPILGRHETFNEMCQRVSKAIMHDDPRAEDCYQAMGNHLWMPAGRILAGAGTSKRVTLLNCFVNSQLEDDMESIAHGLSNIMLTMQQGGGIGTDFSPIRPELAVLHRTGSTASGPGPFMDTWDSACTTIRSAGDRRGAMMGTLLCTHPFLLNFIDAKHKKGRWENFNVSILVTDAFMGAVQEDEDWQLYHEAIPSFERDPEIESLDFVDEDTGIKQYVYSVHPARELWDKIIKSTYEYAEPGVIFIDRVNDMNNLAYVEHIQCTNPCGEQPLPPHGCCDLGAVMLSRMIVKPFTEEAHFNWALLKDTIRVGVRFLDNVIDVTNYPLKEQQDEEFAKRRIGIGVSGLADAMHMLGMRYGSAQSIRFAEEIMQTVAETAYDESVNLAIEKGSFPLFDADKFCERPFIKTLSPELQERIRQHGIRNGVTLTIAPTGTTSIAYGNGSSGLEPVFSHSMRRKVRQGDNTFLEYDELAYGARLFCAIHPSSSLADLPAYMNVAADVRIHEHVRIQEVCQRWVDASISKTINIPKETTFEEFKDVYQLAFEAGCKGCTTYRESDVRGSILSTSDEPDSTQESKGTEAKGLDSPALEISGRANKPHRDEVIDSRTIKIRWPSLTSSLFFTVGYVEGKPYEVFLNSKDQKSLEWTMAVTILMSKALRTGTPLEELASEFQQIHALEGGWAPNDEGKSQYWPSLLAYLGYKVRQLSTQYSFSMLSTPVLSPAQVDPNDEKYASTPLELRVTYVTATASDHLTRGELCPDCKQYAVVSLSGCPTCQNCGASKCS